MYTYAGSWQIGRFDLGHLISDRKINANDIISRSMSLVLL